MFDHELLIGSAFVAGTEAKEKILNPKTGALLTELAEASVEQVDAAVEAASRPSTPGRGPRPPSARACC